MKMELKQEFLCRRASPKGEHDEPAGGRPKAHREKSVEKWR